MNQPAEDRFKQFEERQVEFEKRLRDVERHTTPIKITQLEIDSGGIHRRLDEIQEDTNAIRVDVAGISKIRESQADLRDRLIEHSEDLKAIKEKQEAHSEILGQLMNFGEEVKNTQDEHTKRFDRVEAKLDLILKLLQPKGE